MSSPQGSGDQSKAWQHYKRTGVILPGQQGEIAARLAARQSEVTEETTRRDEKIKVEP